MTKKQSIVFNDTNKFQFTALYSKKVPLLLSRQNRPQINILHEGT